MSKAKRTDKQRLDWLLDNGLCIQYSELCFHEFYERKDIDHAILTERKAEKGSK
jgi:hypothetical protein